VNTIRERLPLMLYPETREAGKRFKFGANLQVCRGEAFLHAIKHRFSREYLILTVPQKR
jgi:hypothetical protein